VTQGFFGGESSKQEIVSLFLTAPPNDSRAGHDHRFMVVVLDSLKRISFFAFIYGVLGAISALRLA